MTMPRLRAGSVRRSISSVALLAFSVALSTVSAQEQASPIPEALQEKALFITVQTVVAETPSSPAWEATETKSALSGSAVSVKLVGESLVVLVQVTPYQGEEGLLLVTQAQVWKKEADKIHYRTVMNTLRVAYGEPVVFYPLGESGGKAPLRVVIVVNPYTKPPEQSADPGPRSEPKADAASQASDTPKVP